MGLDTLAEIGPRPIPQEPMVRGNNRLTAHVVFIDSSQYIIANLGFSLNFGPINFEQVTFPTTMAIDWIRVYQPVGKKNFGCDPADFPTASYINA